MSTRKSKKDTADNPVTAYQKLKSFLLTADRLKLRELCFLLELGQKDGTIVLIGTSSQELHSAMLEFLIESVEGAGMEKPTTFPFFSEMIQRYGNNGKTLILDLAGFMEWI